MRKMLSLIASAGMFASLAACNNNTDMAKTISDVQKLAVTACSFLPTVETVANILTANASLPAAAIANAICAAVTKPGASREGVAPADAHVMVGDKSIAVKGEFMRGA